MVSSKKIWIELSAIPDPEIPAISIVELGVLRGVAFENKELQITITPTYSGCPAMNQIENDIELTLMGAFSHNRFRDLLLGSFTAKMLAATNRPLLLLR